MEGSLFSRYFPDGVHSLIWPSRLCAPEQRIVFRVLDRNPLKECEDWIKIYVVYICGRAPVVVA